jgi:hypothetical protein
VLDFERCQIPWGNLMIFENSFNKSSLPIARKAFHFFILIYESNWLYRWFSNAPGLQNKI